MMGNNNVVGIGCVYMKSINILTIIDNENKELHSNIVIMS